MEGKVLSPQNHEINMNEVNSSGGKDVCLSKSQLKKIRRHEAIIEWKRKNRQAERDRKKSRVRVVENGESKKERSQKIKQRLLNVLCPNEETVCLHVIQIKHLNFLRKVENNNGFLLRYALIYSLSLQ